MSVVAVIGCGRISASHFPALSKVEGVRIKYACDLIPEKANRAKEQYPKVEQAITDYKIALNDPEVDAVYVLTPNYAHYTVTMDALSAGKHVFCEKPVTVSYELSLEMAKKAEEMGKMLNIGVCNRYHRSVEILEQMNREGKFGNIYHVYAAFRRCRSIPGLGGPFTDKSQSGGGVLIDWGIHFFDLILYILGAPKLVSASCNAYGEMAKDMKMYKYNSMWAEDTSDVENGVNDVDDFITGYVRTSGASISFNGAWAQNINADEMYIDFLGDKGGVRLTYCGQFTFFDGTTLESERSAHDIPNMYYCEDEAFIKSIESGEVCKSNIVHILDSMKLLDSLYASSEKNEEVKL